MNTNMTGTMYKHKIELTTVTDIREFVDTASKCSGKVLLQSNDNFCINAKSLLGVLVAKRLEWNTLYLLSENDVYYEFRKFITD